MSLGGESTRVAEGMVVVVVVVSVGVGESS